MNISHCSLDDSISTPVKAAPIAISQIKDKNERLQAYISKKRTDKFKQVFEARSPFIPYVPIGRWLEKKQETKTRQRVANAITTPIRKALQSNEKIFKKQTIKQIVKTAKKTTDVKAVNGKKTEASGAMLRKNILAEANKDAVTPVDLNTTFDFLPFDDENEENKLVEDVNLGREKTPMALIDSIQHNQLREIFSPAALSDESVCKNVDSKPEQVTSEEVLVKEDKIPNESVSQKIKKVQKVAPFKNKPVMITKSAVVAIVKKKLESTASAPVQKSQNNKKVVAAKIVKPVFLKTNIRKAIEVPQKQLAATTKLPPAQQPSPIASNLSSVAPSITPLSHKEPSRHYQFYKSSLDSQSAYLSLQLKDISTGIDNLMPLLSEDIQTNIHQIIQLGNRIINEKMKNFHEFLLKFENADVNDPKRVTEEDVDNYWELFYDEIEKFKEEVILIREMKNHAMKEAEAKKKKRRTTRIGSDATPSRRSRRIADQVDSPR